MNTSVNVKLKVIENALNILGGHVYWKNKQGKYVWCNKKLIEILKLKDQSEVTGKTDYELYDESLAKKVAILDRKVLTTGKEYEVEESGLDINGKPAIYLSIKTPIKDKLGNIDGLVGISIDISERKKAERTMANLKLAKEKVEIANQVKIKFLENMRYDIRTPLIGIVGCAHRIQMQAGLPKKVTEYAGDLVQSGDALLEFLNKILESISVANGKTPLLKNKFNLREVLEKIIHLNKSQALVKGLELSLDYDETIPSYLIGDDVRVQWIILELLTNALKYTEKGSIKISACVIKNKKREVVIELRVSDTGIGISRDKHNEVYTRFTRLIPSSRGVYPGAGLGLSVVKQFIDDLNGEIHIESEIGKGTTFICVVPFQKSLLVDEPDTEDQLNIV